MEIRAEESGFEKAHIPEGIHYAELIGASDTADGQYGPRVALDFAVYHSTKERPATIGRVFGKKLTPRSKLWDALCALGSDVEVGETVQTEALIGNQCRVMIEDYTDAEGKTFSAITKVKAPDADTVRGVASAKEALEKAARAKETPPIVEDIVD